MSRQLESVVREAQQRMAERAPDPDHVRAALPARRHQLVRRQRITLGLTALAAAAAVVAAVAVPLTVLGRSTVPPGNEPTGGAFLAVPVRYGPTWLPAGLAERSRALSVDGAPADGWQAISRVWTADPVGPTGYYSDRPHVELVVMPVREGLPQHQGEPVDVNGEPGMYTATVPDSLVAWRHDGFDFMVGARALALSKEDMLRIARSVRPETGVLRVPLAVGSLPDRVSLTRVSVEGDTPTSWLASFDAPVAPRFMGDEPRTLTISVGTTNHGAGGERLTVGGRPARLIKGNTGEGPLVVSYLLIVDVGRGLELTVSAFLGPPGDLTEEEFLRTAEAVTIDPNPDLGWLGGRP